MYTFIGMGFLGFLTILIAGIIAALVLHYAVRFRYHQGFHGFMSMWIAGWVGAWLGSPVLGHWWIQIANIWALPALIGAFIGAFSVTAFWKGLAQANASGGAETTARAAASGH
ncbi:MAG: hypothetical protein ACRD2E_09695 [Terriglobales bacterium]